LVATTTSSARPRERSHLPMRFSASDGSTPSIQLE
jgi:hypothetical protein